MNKYKVKVIEVLEKEIEIDAFSKAGAINKAEILYMNEDIVLDYNDFKQYRIIASKEED